MDRKVVSFTLKALKEAYVNIHSDVIWCKNKITSNFPWNTGSKQNVIQEDKFIELSSICYNIPTLYYVPKCFKMGTQRFIK